MVYSRHSNFYCATWKEKIEKNSTFIRNKNHCTTKNTYHGWVYHVGRGGEDIVLLRYPDGHIRLVLHTDVRMVLSKVVVHPGSSSKLMLVQNLIEANKKSEWRENWEVGGKSEERRTKREKGRKENPIHTYIVYVHCTYTNMILNIFFIFFPCPFYLNLLPSVLFIHILPAYFLSFLSLNTSSTIYRYLQTPL